MPSPVGIAVAIVGTLIPDSSRSSAITKARRTRVWWEEGLGLGLGFGFGVGKTDFTLMT